jgi:hypothetical protein
MLNFLFKYLSICLHHQEKLRMQMFLNHRDIKFHSRNISDCQMNFIDREVLLNEFNQIYRPPQSINTYIDVRYLEEVE